MNYTARQANSEDNIAVNYFRKTPHRRFLTGFWICIGFLICHRSEYTVVPNIPGFWICIWFWICQGSGYTKVLNMPGLHRVFNIPEYDRIIPGYDWLCLNVPKFVWMTFVLHLPIVISYLKEPKTVALESQILIFLCSSWKYFILFIILEYFYE